MNPKTALIAVIIMTIWKDFGYAVVMYMAGLYSCLLYTSQVWYLDLFAGKNDHEAVRRAGESGHKEINRTNLSVSDLSLIHI